MKQLIGIVMVLILPLLLFGQGDHPIDHVSGTKYPGATIEPTQFGYKFVHPDSTVQPSDLAPTYEIGDTVGQGVVVYVDETKQHGLIAAFPEYIDTAAWSDPANLELPFTDRSLYAGMSNTIYIAASEPNAEAAGKCLQFGENIFGGDYESGDNKGDWFLPSIDEMGKLFLAAETQNISFGPSIDSLVFGYPVGFTDEYRDYWTSKRNPSDVSGAIYIRVGYFDPMVSGNPEFDIKELGTGQANVKQIWPFRRF